jgi:hypothetical protein
MAATIIHSLQGFHIYYGMYVVARKLVILLLLFFLFYRIVLFKREIMRDYLKEIFMPLFFLFLRAYFRLTLAFKTK